MIDNNPLPVHDFSLTLTSIFSVSDDVFHTNPRVLLTGRSFIISTALHTDLSVSGIENKIKRQLLVNLLR